MKIAADLKKGDTFRKQGYKFTVDSVTQEEYKNGNASIIVACSMNDSKVVDSFFHFKPATKIK